MSQQQITKFFTSPSPSPSSSPSITHSLSAPVTPRTPKNVVRRPSKLTLSTGSWNRKRKFQKCNDDDKQMIIDAGQKQFGAQFCDDCKMCYNPDHIEDAQFHNKHHKEKLTSPLSNERLIRLDAKARKDVDKMDSILDCFEGRVYRITESTKSGLKKKFENLMNGVISEELGSLNGKMIWTENKQAFVFITKGLVPYMAGCVLVESINAASKLKIDENSHQIQIMEQKEKAMMGVNRIWVHEKYRRKGIASQLLETTRCNVIYGCPVPIDQVAFSDPTAAGLRLARKFSGGFDKILAYKFDNN